jgi:hypothetical protein
LRFIHQNETQMRLYETKKRPKWDTNIHFPNGVKRISGLIHEETRGALKVPWKRHLWRCHLHRASSQTGTAMDVFNSLRDRNALFTDSKVKYLRAKGATPNQNGVFNTTIVYHSLPITGTLQMTRSHFASGWCPPISIFWACHEYDHLVRALSVLDARGPFGLMEAKPPEPQFA